MAPLVPMALGGDAQKIGVATKTLLREPVPDIIGLTFIYDFGTFVDGDVDIFSLQR